MNVAVPSSGVRAPAWIHFAAACTARLPRGRWRMATWLSRCHRDAFLARLPQSLGAAWYSCNPGDGIAAEVYFAGQYEPQETLLIRGILSPGQVFVDVGANWGYFSLIAASLVGDTGRVLALEPHPLLFDQLRLNLARNQMRQAVALPVAACDHRRELSLQGFEIHSTNFGVSRLVSGLPANDNVFRVQGDTLDGIFEQHEIRSVDLLKMDIEGAELLALRGLDLFAGRCRRILLELHPRQLHNQGISIAEIVDRFAAAGYQGWVIDHSGRGTRSAARLEPAQAAALLTPHKQAGEPFLWRNVLWTARGIGQPIPLHTSAAG